MIRPPSRSTLFPYTTLFRSLHRPDHWPLSAVPVRGLQTLVTVHEARRGDHDHKRGYFVRDRKSTRLNSSHANISYAVFCLKKKKKNNVREVKRVSTTTVFPD